MKIIITESQYKLLTEQNPAVWRSHSSATQMEDILKGLSFEEFMEKFREILYSPGGVATTVFISSFGWGVPAVVVSYGALLAYDIYKSIETGEPDWFNLFIDFLGIMTSGAASIVLTPLKTALKLTKGNLPSAIKVLKSNNNWLKIKEFFSKLGENINLFIQKMREGIVWLSEKTGITFLKNAGSNLIAKLKQFINDILEGVQRGAATVGINVKYTTAAGRAAKAYAIQDVLSGGLPQP